MGDRISLLGVNEAGEEERIPDEEDWSVVAHHVPVALLRVKLDSEAAVTKGWFILRRKRRFRVSIGHFISREKIFRYIKPASLTRKCRVILSYCKRT